MKKQQVIMLASRLSAGGQVRTAGFAVALAAVIYHIVNIGFPTPLWAAPPEASVKRSIQPSLDSTARAKVSQSYGQLPLSFEPNRGQTDPQVRFLSRGRGYQVFLTGNETVLSLKKPSADGKSKLETGNPKIDSRNPKPPFGFAQGPERKSRGESRTPDVLRMKLVGANQTPTLEGADQLPGVSNYFIGKDATQWRTHIPNFRRVVAKQVYPGVDLVYYGQGRQLEYDFIVAPGANPSSIRFALDIGNSKLETGNWKLENRKAKNENRHNSANPESRTPNPGNPRIDANGDLVIALDAGEVRFHKPLVYQEGSPQPSAIHESRIPNPGPFNRQSTIDNSWTVATSFLL